MATEVHSKRTEQPDMEVVHKKKDIFERAMEEQSKIYSSDFQLKAFRSREEYSKMNMSTIDNFIEELAKHPDHNLTVRGRSTNTITNLQFTNESFEDYSTQCKELKELHNKVKRNADNPQPKLDLQRKLNKFTLYMRQEIQEEDKMFREINEDTQKMMQDNDYVKDILSDLQLRIGKLENALGTRTPSKLVSLDANPLLDPSYKLKKVKDVKNSDKFVKNELDKFTKDKLGEKKENNSWASEDDED